MIPYLHTNPATSLEIWRRKSKSEKVLTRTAEDLERALDYAHYNLCGKLFTSKARIVGYWGHPIGMSIALCEPHRQYVCDMAVSMSTLNGDKELRNLALNVREYGIGKPTFPLWVSMSYLPQLSIQEMIHECNLYLESIEGTIRSRGRIPYKERQNDCYFQLMKVAHVSDPYSWLHLLPPGIRPKEECETEEEVAETSQEEERIGKKIRRKFSGLITDEEREYAREEYVEFFIKKRMDNLYPGENMTENQCREQIEKKSKQLTRDQLNDRATNARVLR
jgi:hypothetical protein